MAENALHSITWVIWGEMLQDGDSLWHDNMWCADGSLPRLEHILDFGCARGWERTACPNAVLVTPKIALMRIGKAKATMLHSIFHLCANVAHHNVGGVTTRQWVICFPCSSASKETDLNVALQSCHIQHSIRHVLRYVKGGWVVMPSDVNNKVAYRGSLKDMGALHPNSVLSTLKPLEEVMALGPASTG
eukprot:8093741-Ditylum_brightwellii.AAC.2